MEGPILPINAPQAIYAQAYMPPAPAPRRSPWTELGTNLIQTIIGGLLQQKIKSMLDDKAEQRSLSREKELFDYKYPREKELRGMAYGPESRDYHKDLAEYESRLRQQEADRQKILQEQYEDRMWEMKTGGRKTPEGWKYDPPKTYIDPILGVPVTEYPGYPGKKDIHPPLPNVQTQELGDKIILWDRATGHKIAEADKPVDQSKVFQPTDFGKGLSGMQTPDGRWHVYQRNQNAEGISTHEATNFLKSRYAGDQFDRASEIFSRRMNVKDTLPGQALLDTYEEMKQITGNQIRKPMPQQPEPAGGRGVPKQSGCGPKGCVLLDPVTGNRYIRKNGKIFDFNGVEYDEQGNPIR